MLPETIGNVTALTAGNRVSAPRLEGSDGSGHTDSWPVYYLSTIWRTVMSKERRSHREDKKKPAMTPKEKKAARKSRKESRNSLGEHGVR